MPLSIGDLERPPLADCVFVYLDWHAERLTSLERFPLARRVRDAIDSLGTAPRKGAVMARKTVVVSDISGKEIPDGKGARITISFGDARRGTIVLDVTDDEAEELGAKGRRQSRRGRRPKAAA
jgi:hypothetical protein